MGVAIAINGAVLAAVLLSAPETITRTPPDDLGIELIPLTPPPEPEIVPEREVAQQPPRPLPPIDAPVRLVETVPSDTWFTPTRPPMPPGTLDGIVGGSGTGVTVDPPRPVPPVMAAPGVDPRFAGDFQPDYPASERRAGREGTVVVRVLVGVDGRVKALERVSATSDAFWRATEQRARSKWRFTPGTADGVPVEAWRRMSLTFVLRD